MLHFDASPITIGYLVTELWRISHAKNNTKQRNLNCFCQYIKNNTADIRLIPLDHVTYIKTYLNVAAALWSFAPPLSFRVGAPPDLDLDDDALGVAPPDDFAEDGEDEDDEALAAAAAWAWAWAPSMALCGTNMVLVWPPIVVVTSWPGGWPCVEIGERLRNG